MKKSLALLMALIMAMGIMAGCGKEAAVDTSFSDVKEKGVLVMGLDDSFPPMGFRDENQDIVGFDVDVAKAVAEKMGVELKLQPIDWAAKEQELSTGNIDCIWNGFTKTPERDENMTLSIPYMKNTQVVVVLADSEINTIADLAGKVVDVQSGSSAELAIEGVEGFKESLKELVAIADNVKAMMDLGIEGADAVVMDEVVARYYMAKSEGKYRLLDEKLADEEYVIGFKKGNETLRDGVTAALKSLKEEGTLQTIAEKWFGADITTIE